VTKRKSEPCSSCAQRPSRRSCSGARSGSPRQSIPYRSASSAWASGNQIAGIDCRHLGQRGVEQGELRRAAIAHRRQHRREHVAEQRHHRAVVLDEAELDVEADVLGEVAGGGVRLGAEDRTDLVDALEDADRHLLVELRRLSQKCGPAEVVDGEDLGAALGSGAEYLRRLDLGEAAAVQGGAEAGGQRRLDPEHRAPLRMAQADDGVVEEGVEAGLHLALVQLERRRLGQRLQHCDPRLVQLDTAGRLGHGDGDAGHFDDRFDLNGAQPLQALLRVDDGLGRAPAVAHDQEVDLAQLAELVEPAPEPDPFADVPADLGCPDPFHGSHLSVPPRGECGRAAGPGQGLRHEEAPSWEGRG
jgi:hypothetical protein